MNRLKSILGYVWAILAIPIVLATFIGMDFWARGLAKATAVKISPWYTGGEVTRTRTHKGYRTEIHRPVFDGLLGERDEGFVQINWIPEGTELPPVIEEEIDFNGDGSSDFFIRLNTRTNEAFLRPYNGKVISVRQVLNLGNERVVRIWLKRT